MRNLPLNMVLDIKLIRITGCLFLDKHSGTSGRKKTLEFSKTFETKQTF